KYNYDETTHNGVPATEPDAFKFSDAESWGMEDDEVIGTGPFKFGQWNPGAGVRIDKFWDYKEDALACFRSGSPPVCTGDFYGYMHQPYIDGMLFKIYKTLQAAVFALQAGEIDHVGWSILPEFVGNLLADPNVDVEIAAASSFAYLSYNMRRSPFGYPDNDPTQGDDGLHLRRAVAHATNKVIVVTTLLQNFGVAGDQPVSPASLKWYNASVAKYDYDLDKARQILDDYYTIGGLWADPADPLGTDPGTGYRRLPSIGADKIEILCPQADYDPVLAQTCNVVANDMRAVGLNADAHLVAFGQIAEKLRNRDAQMWLIENNIHTAPPDYYYSFFHARNARVGLNHAGFRNQTFDDVLQTAMSEMDVNTQATLIKEGSGILSSNMPCDPIFFRSYINAYRSDRFINWTVARSASIFHNSYWSWIGVHPPWPVEIDVLLHSGNIVFENEVLGFEVLVT
ncbi:MAG: ABC transporter substrate-binding protein, partial [Candidatus Thermoplasmatota archaeon]|nr:ABC transporter substrate-binding protein [Candidatus Thermoplasmatota archaeon]